MSKRRSERRAKYDESEEQKTTMKVKVSYTPVRQKGLRVIARIDADGFYYPGLLTCFTLLIKELSAVTLFVGRHQEAHPSVSQIRVAFAAIATALHCKRSYARNSALLYMLVCLSTIVFMFVAYF